MCGFLSGEVRSRGTYWPAGAPIVVGLPIVDGARDAGRQVEVGQAVVEWFAAVVVVVGLGRIRTAPPRNQQEVNRNCKDDK